MYNKFKIYLEYSKPKVWWLLVFTGFAGALLATKIFNIYNAMLIIIVVLSVTFGSIGAEGLTNYIDYDMDSIMERTKNRPLPKGLIKKKNALAFGYFFAALSVILLIIIAKYIAAIFMVLGIFDNVFIYSYLLKKKSPYSIILGGFSGAFPVLIGWYTLTSTFSWLPWILFLLVLFWIPLHVWSLVYRYKDDYEKAGVPMLPVVYSSKTTAFAISFSSLLLIVFSLFPYFLGIFDYLYLITVLILSIPIIVFSYMFIKNNDRASSFKLFVYTAPYLTLIYVIVLIMNFVKIY